MKTMIAIVTATIMLSAVVSTSGSAYLAYAQSENIRIDGAGATFAFPLIDLWRVQYKEVDSSITLNYQSIGSGGGVRNHIDKTVAFGATEAPLTDNEYAVVPGTITIPNMIGAVSVTYNIPDIPRSGLKMTEEALCGIFLGDITKWNDPAIADANPTLQLPDETIFTIHRSDGSGTTFAFTNYLTKTCPEWDERVGAAKSVQWPVGVGSPGNEGVAGTIRTTDNSVGYVTLAYAYQNDMKTASIQNGDHTNFVAPSIDTASAASASAAFWLPTADGSWRSVDLLAAPGFNSYPITSFSYIILHPDLNESTDSMTHAKAVVNFIAWTITDGQLYNAQLQYVPIADPVRNIGLKGLAQITYNGQSLYDGPTNVWSNDSSSAILDDWINNLQMMYDDGDIDQSTFLNLMVHGADLYALHADELISDSQLSEALDNILP